MSPIALPHTLDLCPPALLGKGVKWHRQGCSLIASVILLRKICIALFPSQRCQMDRFWFFLAKGIKDQGSDFAPPLAFNHKLGGACWIQSLWAVKISGVSFNHLRNAQSSRTGDSKYLSEGCCQLCVILLLLRAGPGVPPCPPPR